MAQGISSRVPIPIESFALVENMSPRFDGVVVARTREVLVWEES